jgi:hypothetical protein
MTGVRNMTLLLGKSLPRLVVVVLLILVAAPFLMLAVTLGGVISEQIIASLLGLMCYAFCLSQLALFASTASQNSSRAVSTTFILWLVLEFGSWLFFVAANICAEWGWLWLQSVFSDASSKWWERTMWFATGDYLMFERGESILHSQMTFHLVIGAAFFGLSLLLFERFNQHAISQGAAATVNITRGLSSKTQALRSLRCWDGAMEWKSWQFIGGGQLWFWIWLIALPSLSVFVIIFISALVGEIPEAEVFGICMMMVGVGALAILLGRMFGNFLNREIFEQTLVSLCMLPEARGAIVRRLWFGLTPFLIPPVVCFGLGYLVMLATEPRFIRDTAELVFEPWFWATLSWVVVTVHLGVLLSVYLRHGGMLIAIAMCWILMPFLLGLMMAAFFAVLRVGSVGEQFFQYFVPLVAMCVHAAICVVVQRLILARVEDIAAK